MMTTGAVELRVRRIGYLVPGPSFVGTVHSVYARACNVASGGSLLTLVAPGVADGPTALVLGGDRVVDLRTCFQVRDRVVRRGSRWRQPDGSTVSMASSTVTIPTRRTLSSTTGTASRL